MYNCTSLNNYALLQSYVNSYHGKLIFCMHIINVHLSCDICILLYIYILLINVISDEKLWKGQPEVGVLLIQLLYNRMYAKIIVILCIMIRISVKNIHRFDENTFNHYTCILFFILKIETFDPSFKTLLKI